MATPQPNAEAPQATVAQESTGTQELVDKILKERRLTASAREKLRDIMERRSEEIAAVRKETRQSLVDFLEKNAKYNPNVSRKFKDFSAMMVPKLKAGMESAAPAAATEPTEAVLPAAKAPAPAVPEKTAAVPSAQAVPETPAAAEGKGSDAEPPALALERKVRGMDFVLNGTKVDVSSSIADLKVVACDTGNFEIKYPNLNMMTDTPILLRPDGELITREANVRFVARGIVGGSHLYLSQRGNTFSASTEKPA